MCYSSEIKGDACAQLSNAEIPDRISSGKKSFLFSGIFTLDVLNIPATNGSILISDVFCGKGS